MKYDSGMTYLHKGILAAVRLMCRNDSKIIEELSPNDGPPAPVTLRDYLKAKYGKTNYSMHSGNVRFICNLNNMRILFNNHILNNLGDTVLTLTWSQVTKFIIDNWDNVFKESAENQPSPAAEDPAETDNPKPTYKDVLLEHYPNFDVSRFEEFCDINCVSDFFNDKNEIECPTVEKEDDVSCKGCWYNECKYDWVVTSNGKYQIEEYLDQNAPANDNTDTKTADLPNPPVPAKVEETTAPFDYSELDNDTADKLRVVSERVISIKAKYIIETAKQVKAAHDLLANYKTGMFGAWCESVGFSRDTGNNLVRVAKTFPELDIAENFGNISPSLLYEASKPSAPKELVEQVKNGDITTHAEYIKLKKELEETLELSKAAEDEYESLHSRHYEDLTKWCAETSELKQRINELENRPLEAEIAKYKQQLEWSKNETRIVETNYDDLEKRYEELDDKNANLELQIKELESRPTEVMVQTDENVLEELKELREENERLKNKDVKNMLLRITLDEFEQLLELTKSNVQLYAAVSNANIIKL